MRKPYWKTSAKAWYVNIKDRQVRLGKDKELAFAEYHKLMSEPSLALSGVRLTIACLVDQFLRWTEANRAPRTHEWYAAHANSFAGFVGPKATVVGCKPYHVTEWLAKSYPNSGDTHRNGACRAVNRAFNWARKQGIINANPIAGMERPAAQPREAYLSPANWKYLIGLFRPDDPFAELLVFMHETGCRPFEARIIEAHHWDRENRRFVLERKNSKGKKVRRVIRLNERATEVVARRALKRPQGPIFLNQKGRPWTACSVNNRLAKLRPRLSFEVFPYIFRHSFCTDALLRGVDPLTVAILLGHKDATMVMRVYSHLVQNDEFLQQKLSQATGEAQPA